MSDDSYINPGSGAFINLLGIEDPGELATAEATVVAARTRQLDARCFAGSYDVAHLQAIHRHLFGDIYP